MAVSIPGAIRTLSDALGVSHALAVDGHPDTLDMRGPSVVLEKVLRLCVLGGGVGMVPKVAHVRLHKIPVLVSSSSVSSVCQVVGSAHPILATRSVAYCGMVDF